MSKVHITKQVPVLRATTTAKTANLILTWSALLPENFKSVTDVLRSDPDITWERAYAMLIDW